MKEIQELEQSYFGGSGDDQLDLDAWNLRCLVIAEWRFSFVGGVLVLELGGHI